MPTQRSCSFSALLLSGLMAMGATSAQTLSFVRQVSSSDAMESAGGAAVDSTGVYVASWKSTELSSATQYLDAFVRKYDPQGIQIWARPFGGPAIPHAVAVSGSAIYVAGNTEWDLVKQVYYVLPGQTSAGFRDGFVRRYDPDGNELWTRQFGEAYSDYADSVTADETGVYVAGHSEVVPSALPGKVFLRKYDPDGKLLWSTTFDATAYSAHVAADSTGVYVAAMFPYLRKFSKDGDSLWTQILGPNDSSVFLRSVATNAKGVYVTGWKNIGVRENGQAIYDGFLNAYDADGKSRWTRSFPVEITGNTLAAATDADSVYFASTVSGPAQGQCRAGFLDIQLNRFDLDGNTLWTRRFGSNLDDYPTGLVVGPSSIYVAGNRSFGYYPGPGVFLAKLEKSAATIAAGPHIRDECVVNAANYVGGGLASGEIVTILGSSLGPLQGVQARVTGDVPLSTTLADTRVLFNGVPGPLLYASDRQTTAIVPYGFDEGSPIDVQVEVLGVRSQPVALPLLRERLGIFSLDGSGMGSAAVLNEDGTVNSPSNPARRGSVIAIYATGAPYENLALPGQLVASPAPSLKNPIRVGFTKPQWQEEDSLNCDAPGGSDPLFAGGVAGSISGLIQINVRLPESVVAGVWVPQLLDGLGWSNGITSAFAANVVTISVSEK